MRTKYRSSVFAWLALAAVLALATAALRAAAPETYYYFVFSTRWGKPNTTSDTAAAQTDVVAYGLCQRSGS
jgi:hypothetical protein